MNEIVVSIVVNGQKAVATFNEVAGQFEATATKITSAGKKVSTGFSAAAKETENLATKLKNMATDALGNIARFTSYFLAVGALTKFIGGAVDEFRKLDAAMRNVQSITLESDEAIKEHTSDLIKMVFTGQAAGESASGLADAMYELVSAGYSSADALTLAKISAEGAAAGLTDTHTASLALLGILQAYHLPVTDAKEVMDQLFTIVDRGVIHFDQLTKGLGMVIPTAAALNIPLNELGAAIELLTREGQQPARVFTNLNDVLTRFLKPNKDLRDAIHSLGYETGLAMIHALGFEGSIAAIGKASGGSAALLAQWFSDVRAIRAILPLAANDGKDFADSLAQHNAEMAKGSRTDLAFAEQQKSLNLQVKELSANFKALGMVLAIPVVGAVTDVARAVNGLFKSLVVVDEVTGKSEFLWERHAKLFGIVKDAAEVLALVLGSKLLVTLGQLILQSNAAGGIGLWFAQALGPVTLLAVGIGVLAQHFGLLGPILNALGGPLQIVKAALVGLALSNALPVLGKVFGEFATGIRLATTGMSEFFVLSNTQARLAGAFALTGLKQIFDNLVTSVKNFVMSGPGLALVITAIYIGLQKLAGLDPARATMEAIDHAVSKFKEDMEGLQQLLGKGDGLGLAATERGFEGMSQAIDAADASLDKLNTSTASKFKAAISELAGFATTLQWKNSTDEIQNHLDPAIADLAKQTLAYGGSLDEVSKKLEQMDSDIIGKMGPVQDKLAKAIKDKNYDAAVSADKELKALTLQSHQLEHQDEIISGINRKDDERKQKALEIKVATGLTTEEIEKGGASLSTVTEKLGEWAKNLKPVTDYFKEVNAALTPEKALLDLNTAALEEQIIPVKKLADAEKEQSAAAVRGLQKQKDAIDAVIQERELLGEVEHPDEQKGLLQDQIALKREQDRLAEETFRKAKSHTKEETLAEHVRVDQAKIDMRKMAEDLQKVNDQLARGAETPLDVLKKQSKELGIQIQQVKDQRGPNQDLEESLNNQLANLKEQSSVRDAHLKKMEAEKLLEIDLSDPSKFGLGSDQQKEFLINVLPEIWKGNIDNARELLKQMGLSADQADDLLKKAQDLKPALQADASAAGNMTQKLADAMLVAGKIKDAFLNTIKDILSGKISVTGHASGVRDWAGGFARVGEHGEEMVFLPRGSSVANHQQTSQIMDNMVNGGIGGKGGSNVWAEFNVSMTHNLDDIKRMLYEKVDDLDRQLRYRAQRGGAYINGKLVM